MNTATYLKLEKHMNTATYLQQTMWPPRARWTVLLRGLAPRAVMAAAVGLLMGSPAPVHAHGGDASLVHACVVKSGGQLRIVRPGARCRRNEKAVDWSLTGPAGLAGPAGPAGLAGPAFPITCPPDSVLTGTTCIDTYEASVWETTDLALIAKIQDGTVTLADLNAAHAVQRGLAIGDLDAAGCPATGNGCLDFYAVSIPGVTPSRFLTWFQAAAAARNAGKRLPSNAEWQAAALGTPDPKANKDNGTTDCNVGPTPVPIEVLRAATPTGSRSKCVSDAGAFDLVGNLHEWVADWVPLSTKFVSSMFPETDDSNFVGGPPPTRVPARSSAAAAPTSARLPGSSRCLGTLSRRARRSSTSGFVPPASRPFALGYFALWGRGDGTAKKGEQTTLEKTMNTATYLQQRQPRARWTVLLRGLAPRAVMAAAVGLLMGSPAPVHAHGGDASLVHGSSTTW